MMGVVKVSPLETGDLLSRRDDMEVQEQPSPLNSDTVTCYNVNF